MSEQGFLEYMAENGYTEVKIKHYKIRDHVWYKTPGGNRAQVILTKGVHVENLDPKYYYEVAETKEFIMYMRFVDYWERITALESGLPFKPFWGHKCNRCGSMVFYGWLFPLFDRDEIGDPVEWLICEDCDWEIMNGYELLSDDYDIWQDRRERRYSEDPINEPYPW